MLFEAEDAEAADDARDAEVVVVEAADPVPGRAGEFGAGLDGEGRGSGVRPGRVEAVEVQHAG